MNRIGEPRLVHSPPRQDIVAPPIPRQQCRRGEQHEGRLQPESAGKLPAWHWDRTCEEAAVSPIDDLDWLAYIRRFAFRPPIGIAALAIALSP